MIHLFRSLSKSADRQEWKPNQFSQGISESCQKTSQSGHPNRGKSC